MLIDSELLAVRADIACLAEEGIAQTEADILERYVGISLAGMKADLERRFGRKLHDGFETRHHARLMALFETDLQAVPGIVEVLGALSGPVCVASSSTPERLRHALGLVGLYERFHPHVFSATMVARGKPAPDLFLHAAAQMRAAPARCVVIEDSAAGVAAADAAGMTAIGFVGGSHCGPGHAERLRTQGAAIVIEMMAALLPTLAALP
ncbi:MAG TPA: HAD-IA family hydrolase [Stellaceae bacterium]|nr:HAD-IA family hydrolase [Stellaceae bacterium]